MMPVNRNSIFLSLAVLVSVLSACVSSTNRNTDNSGNSGDYFFVYRVVDGDTFWGRADDGSEVKVRLIGIDAPESRKTGQKEEQYFGKEAKVYMEQLIGSKRVRLEYDAGKTDRYKRTLAYVFLEDGTFVNAHLIEQGYAVLLTIPPNVRYVDLFTRLQQVARESGRGLWAAEVQ